MKRFLLLGMLSGALHGQAIVTATASPATIRPGQTAVVTLAFSTSTDAAAVEWSLAVPPGWTAKPAAPSAALAASQKQLSCNGALCLAWGMNVVPLPVGPIATIAITAPANVAPGAVQLGLTNLSAASPAGMSVAVTGVPATITMLSPFDVDGDGQISGSDVLAVVTQVISGNCTVDVVGNGRCDALQVVAEVLAWMAAGSRP